jgi:hypothetical protein
MPRFVQRLSVERIAEAGPLEVKRGASCLVGLSHAFRADRTRTHGATKQQASMLQL